MTQPASHCPIDLSYADAEPPRLDVDGIVRRGGRIRRRRRLAWTGAVLAACAAFASVVVGVRGFSVNLLGPAASPVSAPNQAPIDPIVAANPPITGKLTLISSWPPNWTTVAWATRSGEVCFAAFRTPESGATSEVSCPAWNPVDTPRPGVAGFSPLLPSVSLSMAAALDGHSDRVPLLGLASPHVARVRLTFFGRNYDETVVPVPMPRGQVIGVFLAWLKIPPGARGYAISDITSEIGYDSAGHIVATHGPWH